MHVVLSHERQLPEASVELIRDSVRLVLGQTTTLAQLDVEREFIPDKTVTALSAQKLFSSRRLYKKDALEHFFPLQDDLMQVVVLSPGSVEANNGNFGLGMGTCKRDPRPTLVEKNDRRISARRIKAGRAIIAVNTKKKGGKEATRFVATHEMGHSLGLVQNATNHCQNICVMQSGASVMAFEDYNFLFEHQKPFCDPCQDYLELL